MANGNSRALEELMEIGTRVSFKMRTSGDLYHGSIFYYTPQPNGFLFGIEHGKLNFNCGNKYILLMNN